jgi:hypothetical protein
MGSGFSFLKETPHGRPLQAVVFQSAGVLPEEMK